MRLQGRYVLHEELASGGMAAVHLGQIVGEEPQRIVAIKRMHKHLVESRDARAMFLDEARISARIRHPNVVGTLDVLEHDRELFIVMEYVHGVALSVLASRAGADGERLAVPLVVRIVLDVLDGLQAAHEATDDEGRSLAIVHRDVSPQNVMIDDRGVARVLDFGIAKAAIRSHTTREGQIKGKLRYMGPEQFMEEEADVRTDVYAVAVMLWELLTGVHLFSGMSEGAIVAKVLEGVVAPPSRANPNVSERLDAIVLRGLSRVRDARFATCREMAATLRSAIVPATHEDASRFVQQCAGDLLRERAARVAAMGAGRAGDAPALTRQPSDGDTATVVESANPAKAGRAPRRAAWLALPLIALVAAGGLFAIPRRTAPPPPSPAAEVADVADVGDVEVPTLAQTPAAAVASSEPQQPRPPAPAKQQRRAGAHTAARPRTTPPKANCDPMFTIDTNGIRRVKPECL